MPCGTAQDLDFKKHKARIFHLGYLLLLDALDAPDPKFGTKAARLLHAAQQAGMKTSVDVVSEDSDRFADIVSPALKYDGLLHPERNRGRQNHRLQNSRSRRPAEHRFVAPCRRRAVARRRARAGGHSFSRRQLHAHPKGEDFWQSSLKLPAKHIAGTAGAGDAFAAGVLMGLHEGWELQRCLFTGVCVAAASLSHPTCTGGVKSLPAALKLAHEIRARPALR